MALNFTAWLAEQAPKGSILYAYIRDRLKFGPLQGPDDYRPNFKAAAKGLGLGNDLLAERAARTRNEGLPQLCSETSLADHAIARGIDRLPTETMAEFRTNTVNAPMIHAITGRRGGYERAVKRATDKPFTLQSFGRGGFKWGSPGFGSKGWAPGSYLVVVTFLDRLEADELAAVQSSVTSCGKAYRDEVKYINPDAPRPRWRWGRPTFGGLFGPEME